MSSRGRTTSRSFLNGLAASFAQGLLVTVPLAVTIYVVWFTVTVLDGMLPLPVPGLGIVIVLTSITLVGVMTRYVFGQRVFRGIESMLTQLPVVKLVYGSLRDLLQAFVGEHKRFDRPVVIDLGADIRTLGFVTCDRFDDAALQGYVAVYLPQSYNFAGNVLLVPRERVRPIDAHGAQFMAFIVSGGVAHMGAADTFYDGTRTSFPHALMPAKKR